MPATSPGRERVALDAEAASDAGEVVAAEPRELAVEPLEVQLVDLRAEAAVVHHERQQVQVLGLDGRELADVHEQAAVALDEHDRTPGRDRRADRSRSPWPTAPKP